MKRPTPVGAQNMQEGAPGDDSGNLAKKWRRRWPHCVLPINGIAWNAKPGEVGGNGRTALTVGHVNKSIRKFNRLFNAIPENGDVAAANDTSKRRPVIWNGQYSGGPLVPPGGSPGGGGEAHAVSFTSGSTPSSHQAAAAGGGSSPPSPPEAHRKAPSHLRTARAGHREPDGAPGLGPLVARRTASSTCAATVPCNNEETNTPSAMAGYPPSMSSDAVEGSPCSYEEGFEASAGRPSCPGVSSVPCESLDELVPCGILNNPTIKARVYCS
ncbi:hypothetical protein LX32DRAFT_698991 [Colletotrichum zoysiae]|uniref:Uncharacterized protein n=1 Tax=Colletotrichum zoysiae TaxID=1216348 RepID=A0AAD9H445_9PEZI|nr:hypothetical protein LX32DRAFT_698991 [Colletotrichum zoysiae]